VRCEYHAVEAVQWLKGEGAFDATTMFL